jgi:hypothetical protein
MCKAITNKGTQCSRQDVQYGYCTQHANENKTKYQFLMEEDYNALVQRICNNPENISDEDETILKFFALKTKLTSIPTEYSRHFCHDSKYYSKLIQNTTNTLNILNIIKGDLVTAPAARTVDEIEYYKCMAEITKVFILTFGKLTSYPNKATKILELNETLKRISKGIEKKEKMHAEEQLNKP